MVFINMFLVFVIQLKDGSKKLPFSGLQFFALYEIFMPTLLKCKTIPFSGAKVGY
jgi:hypothetical protein